MGDIQLFLMGLEKKVFNPLLEWCEGNIIEDLKGVKKPFIYNLIDFL